MTDFLASLYPWTKALHVVSVMAWMAGLFYLPRLFVYHTEQSETGTDRDALFQTMERKLLRFIMNPAMIATWIFGLMLVFTPGVVDWGAVWPYTKAAAVLAASWPVIASTTNRVSCGFTAAWTSLISAIMASSTCSRPAESTSSTSHI